ncbi:DUF1642 domain-containing protein [Paenibacillus bouchesdurhonensis]|uniref:DUF1642 domain-containing protein n=1 Tax=Paenibacillus bouchesdurhonensis TaxID=1870990 RepID=UPI000DA6062B|nr:DUF1642 domain-containing protein [Paenibacillus bouchesdurhonensis]
MGYKYAVVKTPMVYRNMYVPNGGVTIDIGTVIGYDEESREIFMPRDYAGKFVYLPSIEEIPENELTNLWRNSQIISQQRDKAINDLAKHAQTLVDMQDELNQARKKVSVPQDVAEAIEWFRAQSLTNEEIYELSLDPSDGKYADALHVWSDIGPGDGNMLMEALVNGYTVKQSPEERLQQEIEDLIQEWWFSPMTTDKDVAMAAKELAGKIVEHAKQFT